MIGLAPARHRVADACARAGVHVLNNDKGVLLQCGHGQVAVIGHMLQEVAVARPHGVAYLQDASAVCAHLRRELTYEWEVPGH